MIGWQSYAPRDKAGQGSVPILVSGSLGPIVGQAHPAVGRRWVGRKGAGPTFSKPKWITHVTVGGVHVLNTHMVPSATRSVEYLGRREWEVRRQHFADHIAAIVALVRTLDGPVILCGDLNSEPDFELLQPLHDLGFKGWSTEPTHGKRAIDHCIYLGDVVQGEQWTVRTSSDHRAALSTVTVTL